jgi:hypothetical protein
MGTSTTNTSSQVPKFDNYMKATLAVFANLFFLGIVLLIWGLEKIFGCHQLSGANLIIFALWALVLIQWFNLRASPDRAKALFYMLGRAARSGVTEAPPAATEEGAADVSRLKLIATSLWVPVTLNFGLAGWLIYASGGTTNSPYAQVPIAMMLIGQGVYDIPPIELRSSKIPKPLTFIGGVAQLYWYPLILMTVLLTMLVGLQAKLPLVTRPAPTTETLLITLVMLFASMCINFLTRRSDRDASLHGDELERVMSVPDSEMTVTRVEQPLREVSDETPSMETEGNL